MADPKNKKKKLPSGRHRSQIKRQKQNVKKAEQNRSARSEVRTFIKKVRESVDKKDIEAAKNSLLEAAAIIGKAVAKGIFHANNGSRKVSRLSKIVSDLSK